VENFNRIGVVGAGQMGANLDEGFTTIAANTQSLHDKGEIAP